ncbi:recombinase family protein [Ruminococcus flavefaciens]|uniref:recombinase family protein n=1 Tax=Ruminococcus flavefaciens TaxID=1265 RepID=UPI0026EA9158|nr:recombinase family protein [Ruminococcus flavefaciens]
MPKVAIYCRLSIEDRDKAENDASASIQNQKAMLRDYCHDRDWEIYDIYVDDGYSGIDRSRPEFNRMIRDCETGKIDIVLCKDQSRFSRDTVVIEQLINDKFLEWGIRFIGVADNADTDSESYSTMRLFTSAYNEMYVKDISSKIRRTLAYKREQGQFIGSFAPYGYNIDPNDKHHLVIDEEIAPVVRQIFDMYVSGEGYRRIVQKLNADGIVSPSEYKRQKGSKYVNLNADSSNARGLWTQSTVARILHNEMYTGTLVQGKSHHISYKNKKRKQVEQADWIRIPNAHEAIIDAETWSRTQARLNSHGRVGKRSQELSPLAGKVRCACCGRPMKRNVYYNKAKTIKYYGLQCATYKTGAMNCPNKSSISGLILEKHILDELNAIVEQFCKADELQLADIHSEQLKELERRLSTLKERHKESKERLLKMYKDKLDGLLSDEDYSLFRQNLSDEEHELSARIADTAKHIEECCERIRNTEGQRSIIEKYTHFDKLDRNIADEFIDYVEIGESSENGEREIHIHWKL